MKDTTMDAVLHEWLVLRPVFDDLVTHVCRRDADPRTVPLAEVLTGLVNMGLDRFAALVYAHHYGDTMEDARTIATEVLVSIRSGRRPRRALDHAKPAATVDGVPLTPGETRTFGQGPRPGDGIYEVGEQP